MLNQIKINGPKMAVELNGGRTIFIGLLFALVLIRFKNCVSMLGVKKV